MSEGDIWQLVFGVLIFLIVLLLLAAIINCVCGCCKLNGKLKEMGQSASCVVKQSYLSRHGTGVITLFADDDVILAEMTWNDPGITRPCGATKPPKCGCDNTQWKAVFDPNEPTAVIGYMVPVSGNYWMEYHLGMITNGAIGLALVNGEPIADSASWSMDLADTLPQCGRQLNKSFMLHLNCGDVISVIVVAFVLTNFVIDSYYDYGNFKFLTTMALKLVDPDECNCDCFAPSGGYPPPAIADDSNFDLAHPPPTWQSILIQKAQALSQLIVNSDPIDPSQIVSAFLNSSSY